MALGLYMLDAFAKTARVTIGFIMSVCLSTWNNLAPTGQIFKKFDV
jgi:hypothetical protein